MTAAVLTSLNEFQEAQWKEVSKKLLAKMIAEFLYEDLLKAEITGQRGSYKALSCIVSDDISYEFHGQQRIYSNWSIPLNSIYRVDKGIHQEAWDVRQFLIDIRETIGFPQQTAAYLIKETSNTLLADLYMLARRRESSDEIIHMPYGEIEGQLEGHPWIVFNKGRLGFSYKDHRNFAPECKKRQRLQWLAVSKKIAEYNSTEDYKYHELVSSELSTENRKSFDAKISAAGYSPIDFYYMPIHDWQWDEVIVPFFTQELASKDFIPLGRSADEYLPMQSIRTLANQSNSNKLHVKLPVMILNTAVYRGLPAERTAAAPALTAWLQSIAAQDKFLTEECGLILPGEIASINVNHAYYKQLEESPYQFREMLGVIWRESVIGDLREGESAMTMAALLHVDCDGKPLLQSLLEQSQLSLEEWLEAYFSVVLPPLLHFLYKYGTAFSPHGENTILILKDGVPVRLALKDFVDDVNIYDGNLPELRKIPAKVKDTLYTQEPDILIHFILTTYGVCFLRYMSDLCFTHFTLDEKVFFRIGRGVILKYQASFPQLQKRFEIMDLLQPAFPKVCLNRVRLLTRAYSDNAERPHPEVSGLIENPFC